MDLILGHDFERIKAAYIDVINITPGIANTCKWEYGKHPSDEDLRSYIENDEMYALMDGDSMAGLVAITMYQGQDYEEILWERHLENDQVAVLHLLAVCPAYQGRALGSIIISEAVEIAEKAGMEALRLDTLKTNLPAQHMYEKAGFSRRGEQSIFFPDRGWLDFYYYERILK